MLEAILGNRVAEKVLLYILIYERGYIREISYCFNAPVNGVRQQLRRLENGSVLVSFLKGKIRVYEFNPRFAFLSELKSLLKKAYESLPEKDIERYYKKRTRPRRAGKPL
ncbi:MAG: ArsR family transcriptional regulator [Candidatus Firestonebacteria bacterium]